MKLVYILLPLLITPCIASAQTVLTGRITNQKGNALPGANVFLRGIYDGGNTDSTGFFRFTTIANDTASLLISYIGYESSSRKISLGQLRPFTIRLMDVVSELNTVVITAGSFEASDDKRMMLKPMDIVTTAGANTDIRAAMNLLPGTQRVGEQTGLFVRGNSGGRGITVPI